MPSRNTNEIQSKLTAQFKEIFGKAIPEWDVAKESNDGYSRNLYCPKLDIAVGILNNDRENPQFSEISRQLGLNDQIIQKIIKKGVLLSDSLEYNQNPRYTITIEIEASGSRKHMLGDITNASILGGVRIIAPIGNEKFKQFVKIKDYVDFAIRNGKINSIFRNIIIIEANDLLEVLENAR